MLVEIGESVNSWATKNGFHQRIVADLIAGKLKGTRGIALETRLKMEEAFGPIFDPDIQSGEFDVGIKKEAKTDE